MLEMGDALLYLLSAWRSCRWPSYRRAVDELHIGSIRAGAGGADLDPHSRLESARVLDSLGHCDILFGLAEGDIFVAPSVLARLPTAGLPTVVLCGSRSPESISVIRAAARRQSLKVVVNRQSEISPYAPTRIEIMATSELRLQQLADDVGIVYQPEPSAWILSTMSGSIGSFMDAQAWAERPDINWPRTDFDPVQLRFSGRQKASEELVLSRYQDPHRGQWLYWLWRGKECAQISDPGWGRYAVLASRGLSVIRYNAADGRVMAPATVPLPQLVARALVLCTGFAPSSVRDGARIFKTYRAVPPDVYRVALAKLGMAEGGS